MGRGNVQATNKFEHVYLLSNEVFDQSDQDIYRDEFHNFIDEFIYQLSQKTTFTQRREWITRDQYQIAINGLFSIIIIDNEWSLAIKLIPNEEYDRELSNLQVTHHERYAMIIEDILLDMYPNAIYKPSGSWTSQKLSRQCDIELNQDLKNTIDGVFEGVGYAEVVYMYTIEDVSYKNTRLDKLINSQLQILNNDHDTDFKNANEFIKYFENVNMIDFYDLDTNEPFLSMIQEIQERIKS